MSTETKKDWWSELIPTTITLSEEDWDFFVSELDRPPKPLPKLVELFRKHSGVV